MLFQLGLARFWCIPRDELHACKHSGNGRSPVACEVARRSSRKHAILTASLSKQHPIQWKVAGYICGTTQDSAGHASGAAKGVPGTKQ